MTFKHSEPHLPCAGQVKAMVKECKMDVNFANFEGWTPLCCAIVYG